MEEKQTLFVDSADNDIKKKKTGRQAVPISTEKWTKYAEN